MQVRLTLRLSLVAALALPAFIRAGSWHLDPPILIHPTGTRPSLWHGTVAYLTDTGGSVMFFDGRDSAQLDPAAPHNYEPSNAGVVIAWRNSQSDEGTNEILLWDGLAIHNVSNSPGIIDSDVSAASNGDVLWSREHEWLMYYDAATGTTACLGLRGVRPSVYITPPGIVTYAYQDPDTFEVKYFDGTVTHTVGIGLADEGTALADLALWDGAVAWIGRGEGQIFDASELYFWKAGQTWRVTNDDSVGGVADNYPSVWNDVVVWQRVVAAPLETRVFLWDGIDIVQLTTNRSLYPSFHDGQLAWVDHADGLYLAGVVEELLGDCDANGTIDADDLLLLADCLTGPDGGAMRFLCACADFDADGDVDLVDLAALQTALGP